MLADFASNDYLGLSCEPAIIAAARRRWRSRKWCSLVTGRSPYHAELERTLAAFEGEEDAILFPTGYAANAGAIAALVDRDDVVFCERSNHSCLVDGCRLSGAAFRVFRSDRLDELERHLASATGHRHRWIVTDGVFSMDGTLAPLADLCDIAERYDASLIVDEAHGTGVLGEHGRGACEAAGVTDRIAVRTGTLSKAVGALGGFVAGPRALTDYLWNHARTQMFSTALPPALCAAATAAIRIIEAEPERRRQLAAISTRFRERIRGAALAIGPPLLSGEGLGVRGRPAASPALSSSDDPGSPPRQQGTRTGDSPSLTRRATKSIDLGENAVPIIPVILGRAGTGRRVRWRT